MLEGLKQETNKTLKHKCCINSEFSLQLVSVGDGDNDIFITIITIQLDRMRIFITFFQFPVLVFFLWCSCTTFTGI